MLSKIRTILVLTFIEEWRSRLLAAVVLFCAVSLYLGLVLSRLAIGFEERFFRDLSLGLIEIFSLVFVLTVVYRVIFEDLGKGSLAELFFVRGVRPWQYLCGRYLGILSVVYLAAFFMLGIFFIICLFRGFLIHKIYGTLFFLLCLRLNIVVAVAILLTTLTTNQASFFVSTFLIYVSGHSVGLLKDLLEEPQHQSFILKFLAQPAAFILPDFSKLALPASVDAFIYGIKSYSSFYLLSGLGYCFVFSVFSLVLACLIFDRNSE